ncbi:MAG: hypothetical protein EPN88_10915 [Bacteroidetes bacterium]|nr:MAG: hypothetical protein EPN88_10915 [Bacteroidota bacterium]
MFSLPEFDRDYLVDKGFQFEEKIDAGRNGLIIRNWVLPDGKYTIKTADLLIIIPQGYPEVRPDMWYFSPELLLKLGNRQPRQTQAKINFEGRSWQRWSRHFPANEWRSGIDGIHTYIKKIITAIEVAS